MNISRVISAILQAKKGKQMVHLTIEYIQVQ